MHRRLSISRLGRRTVRSSFSSSSFGSPAGAVVAQHQHLAVASAVRHSSRAYSASPMVHAELQDHKGGRRPGSIQSNEKGGAFSRSNYHGRFDHAHKTLKQINSSLSHRIAERGDVPSSSSNAEAPLVVVVGWMGAKDSQLKTYHHFYHSHGMDTLTLCVGPKHVLYPEEAMKTVKHMMDNVIELSSNSTRRVVFHSFSMGGYLFGQALRAMQEDATRYGPVPGLIKAQVFDSPPDMDGIATGLSKSLGLPKFLESSARKVAETYLAVTANTAGVHHRAASQAFHHNFVPAPALWYYSKADPIAEWRGCETVIGKWRARGTDVSVCSWEDTPHVLHARHHPDRYFTTLQDFLVKAQVIEP